MHQYGAELKEKLNLDASRYPNHETVWHWDLAALNIIVDRKPENTWEVSAILDWDGALSVLEV